MSVVTIFQFIYFMVALLTALTIHEASHALVATVLGDSTPKKMGRLSLNPFAHLDPIGVLVFIVTVSLWHIGLAWGKPVQIDAEKLKPGPKIGMALIAIAGPISNFLLAAIFAIPLRFHWVPLYDNIRVPLDALPFGLAPFYVGFGSLLVSLVVISLALAFFNLIPIAPLDGSRLWQIILPTKWYYQVARYEIFGLALVLGLVLSDQLFGTGVLQRILLPPIGFLWRFLVGTSLPV